MNYISEKEKQFLIDRIRKGETIPFDFKEKLFPTLKKEYELVYAGKMKREDLLADEDGTFAVPLQIEKIYNGERELFDDGWRNMLVFGDNLQFLKTIYRNEDEILRDKVKGKVKLIYIDPPFATERDFKSTSDKKAYTDKTKGAEFIEFLRRRLIIAKEILAKDGCICVHLDYRKKHYLKVLMDEIFDESCYKNEIVVSRIKKNVREKDNVKKLNEEFDTILFYANKPEMLFRPPTRVDYKPDRWHGFDASGYRKGMDYDLFGFKPPMDRHWHWEKQKALQAIKNYDYWLKNFSKTQTLGDYYRSRLKLNENLLFLRAKPTTGKPEYFIPSTENILCNNLWNDITALSFQYDYPTEKNEKLLYRIIEMLTQKDDIVLDFFAGSGTTAAVAEKLNRRWIVCDIGKLSFYTIQKRLLKIEESKSLLKPTKKYSRKAKTFITINTGLYDLNKLFELNKEKYIEFVTNLFEVEKKEKKINGFNITGERNGYYTLVWPWWEYKNASVDEIYLNTLHSAIGKRIGKRFYIIVPANWVDFVNDYHEIGDIKYYFLKVPYQIIQDLHKKEFKKFRQPQSKNNINDLDNSIGFHFMRQPEVESIFRRNTLIIKKFLSSYTKEDTGDDMKNFESLSIVLIDNKYNGKDFIMSNFYFAEDLLNLKTKNDEEQVIIENLKKQREIRIPLNDFSTQVCIIYVDIYGNEFREVLNTK